MQFPPTFLIFLHSLHETQLEEKNKNSPELTSWKCYNIDFTEGHRSSLRFFHLFPKQDI